MRYIQKGEAPQDLLHWFDEQLIDGQRINSRFGQLDSGVKANLKRLLLQEQGWLCCYTGLSVFENTAHIEHIYPESLSKINGTYEDVDYYNMLAAFPKDGHCAFGAKAREDDLLPVHPLTPDCEARFRFDTEGHILGNDEAAEKTIKMLKLQLLDAERKKSIDKILFPMDVDLTREDFLNFAENYCTPSETGELPQFCYVITCVARDLLNQE
jgi:uncharacterized protein (TIGR02646 family)